MNIRNVWSVTTAAVLTVGMAAFAQTSQPSEPATQGDAQSTQTSSPDDRQPQPDATPSQPSTQPRTTAQRDAQSGTPITLIGCVQREADYRKATDAGRGGPVATGVGLGNEYVLVNAMTATGSAGSQGADCAAASGGSAYELSGSKEGELAQFVGRRVELVGMMKNSDTAVGTSGSGGAAVGTAGSGSATSGGFDPLGQDLRLPEVDVTSIREAAATPPAATRPAVSDQAAPQATPAPEPRSATPEPQPQATSPAPAEPASTGTSGSQNELPRTASPLALAGLTGLLSLAGAMGIRRYRRRS